MEPNEAEMREAREWASNRTGTQECYAVQAYAYAAALAKCRGMVEAERERCAKIVKNIRDLEANGSERERFVCDRINTAIRGGGA